MVCQSRVLVRVLPTSEVLKVVKKLGLVPDQIDAIKAPFSKVQQAIALARSKNGSVCFQKKVEVLVGFEKKIEMSRTWNGLCDYFTTYCQLSKSSVNY